MAGILIMEDIERDYARVIDLSDRNIELSELMNNAYLKRSDALNEVFSCWSEFDEAKSNLSKAKRYFQKGKIDGDEYQWFVDEFHYHKRCAKKSFKKIQRG